MSLTHTLVKPPIAGFEGVNRYWDQENQIVAAKLMPGDYYVTSQDEMITTVLGSCVAACIRDCETGIGGMNHFMLPETSDSRLSARDEAVVGNALRYGNYAMEHLINTILQNGGKRKNLEVKLFGGGKIIASLSNVGARNVQFVLDYVDTEALKLVSHDLGDIYPRKVNFFPRSGRVRMKKIKDLHNQTIFLREKQYSYSIKDAPVEGSVELF
ncbi:chemoreceptor glutamine deamidase CheD [Methylomonas koyamae]|uniref:Probable chemoreceptor glutamine deamidase CheD n=1 Tax=Methylomonas koyamae TaxID=702114 RepID=A0A291IIR5_9GAMM|nr:chemoreceptor glutamine deamidase CheD [Methylomonas koyamae]ATG90233.1 chemotaxis protein CheD [Methylomonas koyamae]OAI25352.1 chemotaxis protein CheD [Methylomonas koyamae]